MDEVRIARASFVESGQEQTPNLETVSREELVSMLRAEQAKTADLEARLENSAARALIAEAAAKQSHRDAEILVHLLQATEEDLKKSIILNNELFNSDRRDKTFGVLNRNGFFIEVEEIRSLLDREPEKNKPQGAVMMIDIDKFKDFNDKYGHAGGDNAIRALIEELKRLTRHTDIIGRYGGEEFLVFFPNATAEEISQKLTQEGDGYAKINVTFLPEDINKNSLTPVTLTVSGGVVDIQTGEDIEKVVVAANTLLQEAKKSGRNRILNPNSEVTKQRHASAAD